MDIFDIEKENYIKLRISSINRRFVQKVENVRDYLQCNSIKTVNVLYSGGADSTLVLMILEIIKQKYIKDLIINAYTIDYKDGNDTFNNDDVEFVKSQNRFKSINFIYITPNINVNNVTNNYFSKDIIHQHNYAYRYTLLFTFSQNNGGITIETTNLDELSYVGWFGKNSDMVVDLQIISDLHKFEIMYLLEKFEIEIADVPKGGLLSGLSDEESFGVDYNTLSYYSYCMCKTDKMYKISSLDDLHNKNKHKYYGQKFNPYFIVDKNSFFICNRMSE